MSFIESEWWWVFAVCASVLLMGILAVMLVATGVSYHRRRKLHKSIWAAQKTYSRLMDEEDAINRNIIAVHSSRSLNADALSGSDAYRSMYSIHSGTEEQYRDGPGLSAGEDKKSKRHRNLPTKLSMRDLTQPRVSVAASAHNHNSHNANANSNSHKEPRRQSRAGSQSANPPTQKHYNNASSSTGSKKAGAGANTNANTSASAYAEVEKPQPPAAQETERAPVREASSVGRGFTNGGSMKKTRSMRQQSFVMEDVEMLDSPNEGHSQSHPPRQAAPPALVSLPNQAVQPTLSRAGPSTGYNSASAQCASARTATLSGAANGARPEAAPTGNPFAMTNQGYYPTEESSSPYKYDYNPTR